jgi:hypothetical protein
MKLWSLTDLMHLTRQELCELACQVEACLPHWESGSVERHNALVSLRNIRRMLALRKSRPGPC